MRGRCSNRKGSICFTRPTDRSSRSTAASIAAGRTRIRRSSWRCRCGRTSSPRWGRATTPRIRKIRRTRRTSRKTRRINRRSPRSRRPRRMLVRRRRRTWTSISTASRPAPSCFRRSRGTTPTCRRRRASFSIGAARAAGRTTTRVPSCTSTSESAKKRRCWTMRTGSR